MGGEVVAWILVLLAAEGLGDMRALDFAVESFLLLVAAGFLFALLGRLTYRAGGPGRHWFADEVAERAVWNATSFAAIPLMPMLAVAGVALGAYRNWG